MVTTINNNQTQSRRLFKDTCRNTVIFDYIEWDKYCKKNNINNVSLSEYYLNTSAPINVTSKKQASYILTELLHDIFELNMLRIGQTHYVGITNYKDYEIKVEENYDDYGDQTFLEYKLIHIPSKELLHTTRRFPKDILITKYAKMTEDLTNVITTHQLNADTFAIVNELIIYATSPHLWK